MEAPIYRKATWAAIVPLIGGMPLAMEQRFGNKPEFVLSWSGFQYNDRHYINYIRKQGWEGKYYVLDGNPESVIPDVETDLSGIHTVDIVCGTPPCAGLSALSTNPNKELNNWMKDAARFVLEKVQPKIYWFENAPRLATKGGMSVADELNVIAEEFGYTLLLYTTESRLHKNCQIRPRTFGFFLKKSEFGDSVHLLEDIPHERKDFEVFMQEVAEWKNGKPSDMMDEPINTSNPADDPYYSYCYDFLKAENHRDFVEKVCKFDQSVNLLMKTLEYGNWNFSQISDWFNSHGYARAVKNIEHIKDKSEQNKGFWAHGITIGRGQIPAFVGVLPYFLVHPFEQRYVTFREGLALMGFPLDFEFAELDPWKCTNHICQNVPVGTAYDMCEQIRKWITGENTLIIPGATYAVQRNKQRDYQVRKQSDQKIEEFF